MPKKRKLGRPRAELTKRYPIRYSIAWMREWRRAARADGRELQNWIQRTLNLASGIDD